MLYYVSKNNSNQCLRSPMMLTRPGTRMNVEGARPNSLWNLCNKSGSICGGLLSISMILNFEEELISKQILDKAVLPDQILRKQKKLLY